MNRLAIEKKAREDLRAKNLKDLWERERTLIRQEDAQDADNLK